MPKEKIKSFIDFFYPPFRKIMPLQTFRYAACGGSNMVLGFMIFTLAFNYLEKLKVVDLGFYSFEPYSVALGASSSTVFIVGFLLNKYVVFIESNLKGRIQLFRYLMSFFFNLCLNYVLLKMLVEFLHLHAILAQMIVTVIIVAISYMTQRHFTFETKSV